MHDLDGALNVGACGSIQSSTVSHDLVSHSVGIWRHADRPVRVGRSPLFGRYMTGMQALSAGASPV